MPAVVARCRKRRVAACRSIRVPRLLSRTGPPRPGPGCPVDGPADGGRQRDQDDLGALAAHAQHPVAVLFARVLGGRVLQDAVEDAGPVEPSRDRESPGDGGGLEPADLVHPPDVELQVRSPGSQRVQVLLGAPGQVTAQVRHIARPALADAAAQLTAAVHFVACHEGGADPSGVRSFDQAAGQLRLGGGHHLLRDAGQLAVLLISDARFGQVKSTADQRMPVAGGVGQGDRHLARCGTAHGAAVLAGRAGRSARGLLIGRLIHDQHPVPVIKMTDRPRRSDVQDPLVVPDRTRQKMLQPVRLAVPGRLGDRPAVVIVQFHQQPAHHLAAGLPGLPPGKAPGHLPQQIRLQRGPGIIGDRGSSDCRILIVSRNPS